MAEPWLRVEVERGHLLDERGYDEGLNLVWSMTMARPGWQLNGHRADCRCGSCRPDLAGLPLEDPDG